jgi:cell division protein FtsW (lipid II flippase)
LPFISSGGTSLLGSLMITGIILNVSRQRKVVFSHD